MKNENRVCANNRSLPIEATDLAQATSINNWMDRREALKATAYSVGLIVSPTSVPAGSQDHNTPILRLFRQRCAVRDQINNVPSGTSDETMDAEIEVLRAIEARLMQLPTICVADFAAKAIVDSSDAGYLSEWEDGAFWKEAHALTGCSI